MRTRRCWARLRPLKRSLSLRALLASRVVLSPEDSTGRLPSASSYRSTARCARWHSTCCHRRRVDHPWPYRVRAETRLHRTRLDSHRPPSCLRHFVCVCMYRDSELSELRRGHNTMIFATQRPDVAAQVRTHRPLQKSATSLTHRARPRSGRQWRPQRWRPR